MGEKEPSFAGSNSPKKNHKNGSPNGYYGGEVTPFSSFDEENDNFDYQRIIEGLLKFKWVILFCTILGGVLAWFYVQNVTPLYNADGTLYIKDGSRGQFYAGSDLSSMLSRSYGIGLGSPLDNEIQLLQSRVFSSRVADRIMAQAYLEDGSRFLLLMDEENPEELLSRIDVINRFMNELTVERVGRDIDIVRLTYVSANPEEAREIVDIAMDEYIKLSREQSRAGIGSALTFLSTELVDIQRNLEASEDALRVFMEQEGVLQIELQTTNLITQVAALEAERETQRIMLASLAMAKENYEQELNGIRPGFADQVNQATAPRLDLLQKAMAELLVERMLILGRNPNLSEQDISEPKLVEINREIELYRREINQLTSDLLDGGSLIAFIDDDRGNVAGRVTELRRLLLDTNIKMNQLQAQEQFIDLRLTEYSSQFENIPSNMIELARLRRNLQVNQEVFVTLARQQTELMLLEQTQMGNGSVFDYAVTPLRPFYPRTNLILLIGLVLGFGASAGVIGLITFMNNKLNSIDRLKNYDYPVLAVVPEMNTIIKEQFKGMQTFMIGDQKISTSLIGLIDPVSHVSEAYRRLYNNIRFSNPDSEHNVLVVTSSTKGEGKTTCISNLAISIAESGKTVLLMDCDYRRPRVHRLFGFSKEPGSSNHLFENTLLDEMIRPSVIPGVDVLTSGTEPPSPGLAINSEKMRKMIYTLREKYDFVLIDTPPYGIITDAAPLIKMADGIVLVTRFDVTTTPELDQILENLSNINANIVGTVMMDYDPQAASGYYSYNKMYSYNYTVYKSYQDSEKEN